MQNQIINKKITSLLSHEGSLAAFCLGCLVGGLGTYLGRQVSKGGKYKIICNTFLIFSDAWPCWLHVVFSQEKDQVCFCLQIGGLGTYIFGLVEKGLRLAK